MQEIKINEIRVYLEKELPEGYLLLMAPQNQTKTLFGVLEYNPRQWSLITALRQLIERMVSWKGGGSFN